MLPETSVHFPHSINHHIPEDITPPAPQTSQPPFGPPGVSATVSFFISFTKGVGCCHVATCCRHSARNYTAMLPHTSTCNLITPLLCWCSRNTKPCTKSQVETSVRAVVSRSAPPSPQLVTQYASISSVKPSGYFTYRSLSH
jgi:hypothetical protein